MPETCESIDSVFSTLEQFDSPCKWWTGYYNNGNERVGTFAVALVGQKGLVCEGEEYEDGTCTVWWY